MKRKFNPQNCLRNHPGKPKRPFVKKRRWFSKTKQQMVTRPYESCYECDYAASKRWLATEKGKKWLSGRRKTIGHYNANKTACKMGHEFTEENTYLNKYKGKTRRQCRTCSITQRKESRALQSSSKGSPIRELSTVFCSGVHGVSEQESTRVSDWNGTGPIDLEATAPSTVPPSSKNGNETGGGQAAR